MPVGKRLGTYWTELKLVNTQYVGALATSKQAIIGFGKVAAGAVAMAGAAWTAFTVKSVKAAMKFEEKMREINTLAKENEQGFQNLSQSLLGMSNQLGKSAVEMADSLYQIQSAGFRGAQGFEVLKHSVKLSVAGLADMESVGDAVTTLLNAYGKEASAATDVTDILFRTVDMGKIKVEEYAQSIGYVASIASTAGIDIRELSSTIAAMTKVGIKSQKSFRALRMLITKIAAPSQQSREAFEDLGFSMGELGDTLREKGILAVLKAIKGSVGNNIEEWQKFIPNVRALTPALALAGKASKEYTKILDNMGDTTDATEKAFGEMNKSLSRIVETTGVRFKNLMIEYGNELLPTVKTLLRKISDPSFVNQVGESIFRIAEAFKKVGIFILSMIDQFANFGEMLGKGLGIQQVQSDLVRLRREKEKMLEVDGSANSILGVQKKNYEDLSAEEKKRYDHIKRTIEEKEKYLNQIEDEKGVMSPYIELLKELEFHWNGIAWEVKQTADETDESTEEMLSKAGPRLEELGNTAQRNRIEYLKMGYAIKDSKNMFGPTMEELKGDTKDIGINAQQAGRQLGGMMRTLIDDGSDASDILSSLLNMTLSFLQYLPGIGGAAKGTFSFLGGLFGLQHGGIKLGNKVMPMMTPAVTNRPTIPITSESNQAEIISTPEQLLDMMNFELYSADPNPMLRVMIKNMDDNLKQDFYERIVRFGEKRDMRR
ncbi:MAG: phage tail tape measure protein [Candidatus Aenigmatarchaeota archaeon]